MMFIKISGLIKINFITANTFTCHVTAKVAQFFDKADKKVVRKFKDKSRRRSHNWIRWLKIQN